MKNYNQYQIVLDRKDVAEFEAKATQAGISIAV